MTSIIFLTIIESKFSSIHSPFWFLILDSPLVIPWYPLFGILGWTIQIKYISYFLQKIKTKFFLIHLYDLTENVANIYSFDCSVAPYSWSYTADKPSRSNFIPHLTVFDFNELVISAMCHIMYESLSFFLP